MHEKPGLRAAWALALLAAARLASAAVDTERLAGVVEEGMALWEVPGMAVAVIDDGEVVMKRGFGRLTPGGATVDEHTLFANASTTKAMVAAGLLILADEGRLTLDDPVIRHLPGLHLHPLVPTGQITIRDLLAHRTGLPSTDFWTFYQRMPLEEQIERLRLVEPVALPRTRLVYQNTMYELAGLVIERVSGQRWDRFLAARLWGPIGMRETYGARGQIPPGLRHVMPHEVVDGTLRAIDFDLPADLADAAGSAWTSIHDMTLWARFLLAGGVTADGTRLISEAGMAAMFEPQQLATAGDFYPTVELTRPSWRTYGLGWFQQDFQGRHVDFHTGSLDGLVAIIGLDRAANRAVIVLGNRDHAEIRHALLWEVMDDRPPGQRRDWNADVFALYERLADEDRQEWAAIEAGRVGGSRPTLPLTAYPGRYRSAVHGDVVLAARGDALALETAMYAFPVTHWHGDTFLVSRETWRYGQFATFVVDPDGAVSALEVFGERFDRVGEE